MRAQFNQIMHKVNAIPNLVASIDSFTTSMKRLDTCFFDAERNIEKCNERLTSVETNVRRLQTNTVKQTEFDKMMSIMEEGQREIKATLCKLRVQMNTKNIDVTKPTDLEEITKKIRADILNKLSTTNPQMNQMQPRSTHRDLSHLLKDLRGKLTSKGDVIKMLDYELLIIGDSKTHPIGEEIIKHNL